MRHYFDCAASAPLRPEAQRAWNEAAAVLGNPASLHQHGQARRRLVEDAREGIAAALDAHPQEVVFTSGGTESISAALTGLCWATERRGIVLPDGEHQATRQSVDWLVARAGAHIVPVGLDGTARIDQDAFAEAVQRPESGVATALVASNEVGTLQPVTEVSGVAAAAGVALHLDAVGAAGVVPLSFRELRGDAPPGAGLVCLSLSGHKLGAPVGTGALLVSRHATPDALVHGSAQRGLRGGTPDAAGAAALAVALRLAVEEREATAGRLEQLRSRMERMLSSRLPSARILGARTGRLPGTVMLHLPGAHGESMLFLLDQAGFSVSTGAACQAGVAEPNHVVRAMGETERTATEVIRVSFGGTTSDDELDALVTALVDGVQRLTGSTHVRS